MFFTKRKKEKAISQYQADAESVDEAHAAEAAKEAADTSIDKITKLERESRIPKPLRAHWGQIKLMVWMSGDYAMGRYREVPWKIIASTVGALGYFVLPLDVLPDIILGSGYLDDAAVLKVAMEIGKEDIEEYAQWRDGKVKIETDTN